MCFPEKTLLKSQILSRGVEDNVRRQLSKERLDRWDQREISVDWRKAEIEPIFMQRNKGGLKKVQVMLPNFRSWEDTGMN